MHIRPTFLFLLLALLSIVHVDVIRGVDNQIVITRSQSQPQLRHSPLPLRDDDRMNRYDVIERREEGIMERQPQPEPQDEDDEEEVETCAAVGGGDGSNGNGSNGSNGDGGLNSDAVMLLRYLNRCVDVGLLFHDDDDDIHDDMVATPKYDNDNDNDDDDGLRDNDDFLNDYYDYYGDYRGNNDLVASGDDSSSSLEIVKLLGQAKVSKLTRLQGQKLFGSTDTHSSTHFASFDSDTIENERERLRRIASDDANRVYYTAYEESADTRVRRSPEYRRAREVLYRVASTKLVSPLVDVLRKHAQANAQSPVAGIDALRDVLLRLYREDANVYAGEWKHAADVFPHEAIAEMMDAYQRKLANEYRICHVVKGFRTNVIQRAFADVANDVKEDFFGAFGISLPLRKTSLSTRGGNGNGKRDTLLDSSSVDEAAEFRSIHELYRKELEVSA